VIVGLTGGIGSGKSTASNMFKDLSVHIVDADQVAREVVEPDSPALEKIIEHFGKGIITNGKLDRTALRTKIFSDDIEKKWLESLLHPLIRESMLAQLDKGLSDYSILEAPLLFENNLDDYCNKTICVDLPQSVQLERSMERDGATRENIEAIMASQMQRKQKLSKCDYVLDNSTSYEQLEVQVHRLHNILSLLSQNPEFT